MLIKHATAIIHSCEAKKKKNKDDTCGSQKIATSAYVFIRLTRSKMIQI